MPKIRTPRPGNACLALAGALAAIGAIGGAAPACTLEQAERYWNEKQPPERVMDAVGIMAGMTVAEIGAGRGRYAVRVAARVGPGGRVYANDIDTGVLGVLARRCARDGIANLDTIHGGVTDPRLPAGTLDFVYVINSYHHFTDPVTLLRNTRPALKPGGRLVIIEHDPEKTDAGFHCTERDTVIAQAAAAGFALRRTEDFLELDTIYILGPAGVGDRE